MNNPKVSIIIPVYNGSNFMQEAIDCALNQTYENVEIVVVNDGSTDGGKTEEIALRYGTRIHYISKPNGGVSSALNLGIANMTGEYFSWLSHDDLYTNNKVKDAIDLLKNHNKLNDKCIAYTGGNFIDARGAKIKEFKKFFEVNEVYSGKNVVEIMTKKGTLNGCCMLIPKSAFEVVGGFDEELRYSQDSLMWYKIFLSDYSLVSDNINNVMNRVHKNQVTNLRRDLYEHDSLVIAKQLAEPLAQLDMSGAVLKCYIKRLTRYKNENTFRYLYDYAKEKGYLKKRDLLLLNYYKVIGSLRYKIVTNLKNIIMRIRK